jgi:hypothetical protein
MDEMREIVTTEQIDRLFLILAIAAPALGVLCGAFLGGRRGSVRRGATAGLLVGLLGPTNLLLWKVYNAITERLGLDTVKNLLVNLGLFIALGVIAGLLAGRYYRGATPASATRAESEDASAESGSERSST